VSRPPTTTRLLRKGVDLHLAGQLAEAESVYNKVLKADRSNADALNLKGLIANDTGRVEQAIALFDRAIRANPNFPEAHFNKANALAALRRNGEALIFYQHAIQLRPAYADAHLNAGLALHAMTRAAEAIAAFRAMTQICPMDARGFYNLGACLEKSLPFAPECQRAALASESAAAFNRALALDPGNPDIQFAYANLCTFLGDYKQAIQRLQIALQHRPAWPEAWNNLASQWEALGERHRAIEVFDHALKLDPSNAGAVVNRGMTCLALGRMAEGWDGLARRFDDPRFPFLPRSWPWPAWRGEDLRRKKIFLWGDQGIGDELLYASIIPDVAALARECVIECDPRLVPLYQRSFETLEIVSARPRPDEELRTRAFDFHCSVLDAGRWLRRSLGAFPNRTGVLKPDLDKAAALRRRYLADAPDNRLVGLSWRSSNPGMGHQKSIALAAYLPLLQTPGLTFVNLQYGEVKTEIEAFRDRHGVHVQNDSTIDSLRDLDSFAAQVSAMDVVVSVSNTTAHFGGSLNVPTFIYVPDGHKRIWYWFDEGGFSPWYRSSRLIRGELRDALLQLSRAIL